MTNILLLLFIEFFKIGLFAFGGGLAAVPFLAEISNKYGWYSLDQLSTMIAVSESTPGPIGINMATYVGFEIGGILGSALTTIAIAIPSLIIVCIIANCLKKFQDSVLIKQIFNGLKPAAVAFIVAACLDLFMSTLLNAEFALSLDYFNIKTIILFLALLIISKCYKNIHPIAIIAVAAVCGIIFQLP